MPVMVVLALLYSNLSRLVRKMIATSASLREELKQAFDLERGWFGKKVSQTAVFKDREYFKPTIDNLYEKVYNSMELIGDAFGVARDQIHTLYSIDNGIFDCDNFADLVSALTKALHYKECVYKKIQSAEYAIFPCIIKNPAHAINISFTQSGISFIEPQTGEIYSIKEYKPDVILVG